MGEHCHRDLNPGSVGPERADTDTEGNTNGIEGSKHKEVMNKQLPLRSLLIISKS